MNKEISDFVKAFNKDTVSKYKFEQYENKNFVWQYKEANVELLVELKEVTKNQVTLICTRNYILSNGEIVKVNTIEKVFKGESFNDLYNLTYDFLIQSYFHQQDLINAEKRMLF